MRHRMRGLLTTEKQWAAFREVERYLGHSQRFKHPGSRVGNSYFTIALKVHQNKICRTCFPDT